MTNWLGYLGAATLVVGGAMAYAPTAPEEPRPQVVAEAPPAPAAPSGEVKPDGQPAAQGG